MLNAQGISLRNNSFANFKLETGFDTEIIEDDIETFKRYFQQIFQIISRKKSNIKL